MAPTSARANHDGCYVLGDFFGLDTVRTCQYVARTTTQNVYVGTPDGWRIWVLRHDETGQPLDITLAEGVGPVAGPAPQVHPEIGETVNVSMFFGCAGPFCNTKGFLGAGLEQGHP